MSISFYEINKQSIEFEPITGPLSNPLMGWAPWATIQDGRQPHTLVYVDLTWRELEPEEGVYDFETLEEKNQLAHWRQEGKRVVFRFVVDKPGAESHLDIPDWLFEKTNKRGVFYDNQYGKGFSPDYSNQVFIQYHRQVIKALGDRYGQDDFFAYIELGSLGHWGEWHVDPEIKDFPFEAVRNAYVSHYIEAFPKTYLLMRRPFSIAGKLGLGLYNDMTGDFISTQTWLGWIAKGGNYSQTGEVNALVPMADGWKTAPIGGEQAPTLSDQDFYGANLEQTLDLIRKSHATFVGPNGPYLENYGGDLQNGIDQVLSTLGYRIYVQQIQMPRWVWFEKNILLQIEFGNNGIAPIYYNWPTNLYILDSNGRLIYVSQINVDLRKIIPGELYKVSAHLPVDNLEKGAYSVGIAIVDPDTNLPAVHLAMDNTRSDNIFVLGSFEVKKMFDRFSQE